MKTFKIGLFINGMQVMEYELAEYDRALADLNYVYEETETPHEL